MWTFTKEQRAEFKQDLEMDESLATEGLSNVKKLALEVLEMSLRACGYEMKY